MRKLFLFISFLAGCFSAGAQQLAWANHIAGATFDVGRAVTVDASGNIYTTGYFSNTVDFDPGPGVFNLTAVSTEDAFITKYDNDGKFIWARAVGAFRYQAGYAIATDKLENVYITGIYYGTVDFNPGPAKFELTAVGNEDIFVLKLGRNGSFQWAISIGGDRNEFSGALKLDNAGNIYLNGYFERTADFDPGPETYNLTCFGQSDIFVCKLNPDGGLVWACQLGGIYGESAYGIDLDAAGNVYSIGHFTMAADFDPGPGVFELHTSGNGGGFISKLSPNGNFIWAKAIVGDSIVRGLTINVDPAGYIYAGGYFKGTADFAPGAGGHPLTSVDDDDAYIAKFSASGQLLRVLQLGGASIQQVVALGTDAAGNLYATGEFNQTTDFDPGPGEKLLLSAGLSDVFLARFDAGGTLNWVIQAGGPLFDCGYGLALDARNNIYTTGVFHDKVDFDPGAGTVFFTSLGDRDVFIQKIRPCGNTPLQQALQVTACKNYTLNNKVYSSSGEYTQVFQNVLGCDSLVITLRLSINRVSTTINTAVCEGTAYTAGGAQQTMTGIYYDTLNTAAGCDSVLITNLTVHKKPQPQLGNDRNLCINSSLTVSPGNFDRYVWQDNSTAGNYTISRTGKYWVTVFNAFNCAATDTLLIRALDTLPQKFLPPFNSICRGGAVELNVPGYKEYRWNNGATGNNIVARQAGEYRLTVTDFNGCTGSDNIRLAEVNCIPISIPNAFTPNGDGLNDLFRPVITQEITLYQMTVLNRYGQKLFESNDPRRGWDGRFKGKLQPAGVYVYRILFSNRSGYLSGNNGTVLVTR